jgi:hypothetical protein
MKTKIKARRMWQQHGREFDTQAGTHRTVLSCSEERVFNGDLPVAVIDVSNEAALIEQAASAKQDNGIFAGARAARAVLEALGILAKPRGIIKQRIPSRSRKAGK